MRRTQTGSGAIRTLAITFVSDFTCPWCWIGHAHLWAGIRHAGLARQVQVNYHPFELDPGLPPEGLDRQAYRSLRTGSWTRSQAMDAEVTQAGQQAGLSFRYDLVRRIPNTRRAHRLMRHVMAQRDALQGRRLFEAMAQAYFSEGRDIGCIEVLADLAGPLLQGAQRVREELLGSSGEAEVIAQELQAGRDGIHSVPTVLIGRRRIRGAQSPTLLASVMRASLAEEGASRP